jgi:ceramide glucosyltransferase
MRLMADIPDLAPLLLSLCDICLATAIIGCIFNLLESALVLGFGSKRTNETALTAPVTVLKPLHGAEPELRARLAAFCRQNYGGPVQVLCGTQNSAASAAAVLRRIADEHPHKAVELAVDTRSHGANPKVSNLINMLPRARHDVLVLSDSDIVVGPGYLRAVTALLASPRVGAVTCLYHGVADEGLWARLSALAINAHFLPQAILAVSLSLAKPCCGATIALRRSTLERIGGFSVVADVLADDHALGLAVRAAGYEVVTAPCVVGHRCFETSLRELLRQQLRVARTIRSIDPIGYFGTIITHPWPLALIALSAGGADALTVAIAVLLSRLLLCRTVERHFGLPRQNYWLLPLHDVIAFAVYVASFFGATVHWRGSDYRVTADGALIEDET